MASTVVMSMKSLVVVYLKMASQGWKHNSYSTPTMIRRYITTDEKQRFLVRVRPIQSPFCHFTLPSDGWERYVTTVGVARELKDFTNFHILPQLHSPIDEHTSSKIGKGSVPDRAKLDHFTWDRHYHELFKTPIAA